MVQLFFASTSAFHVEKLVAESVEQLKIAAKDSGVAVVPWSGSYDGGWNMERLKSTSSGPVDAPGSLAVQDTNDRSFEAIVNASMNDPSKEISKDTVLESSDERAADHLFEKKLLDDLADDDFVPAEQPVLPSHAREMAH